MSVNRNIKIGFVVVGIFVLLIVGFFVYKRVNSVSNYEECVKTSYLSGVNKDIGEIERSCRVIFPTLSKLSNKENSNLECVDINSDKTFYKIKVDGSELTLNGQKPPFSIKIWNKEVVNFEMDSEQQQTKKKVHMNGNIFSSGVGEITVEFLDKSEDDIHYRFSCVEN